MKDVIRVVERAEAGALSALHAAASPSLKDRLGLRLEPIDGGLVSVVEGSPSIVLNRTLGLGVSHPVTNDTVVTIAGLYQQAGVGRYFIHRHPDKIDEAALRCAGLEKARGWMTFTRDMAPPPAVRSDLTVREIGADNAADFARIVAAGFDLGVPAEPLLAGLVGQPNCHVFMAFDGDTPAGGAMLYVHDDIGWCDWAATDPAFRRRGSQSALLAARIDKARQLGCRRMATETGEAAPGDPQHSYHNIERAGFEQSHVRENWAPKV